MRPARHFARIYLISICAVLAAALPLSACGGDDDNGGDNDGGVDSDSGGNGDGSGDTFIPNPPGEDLYFSYRREAAVSAPNLPDYTQLIVVDDTCTPTSCTETEVMPPAGDPTFSCDTGCAITDDMSYVVYRDTAAGSLRYAPLGSDFQISGPSTLIVDSVNDWELQANRVAYVSTTSTEVSVYDLDAGNETMTMSLGAGGGFSLSGDGEQLFVGRVTSLTSMDLFAGISGAAEEFVATFVSGAEGGTGSYYSGNEPRSLSPDGDLLAIVTSGLHSTGACADNGDCDDTEFCYQDASPARCASQSSVVHIINLAQSTRLGASCSQDADCGDYHVCDIVSGAEDARSCIPGFVRLGPTGQNQCQRNSPGEYTDVRALDWRGDRQLVLVAADECTTSGVFEKTEIIAIDVDNELGADPTALERIVSNPDSAHGGAACFDATLGAVVPHQCSVEIFDMALSPSGGTIGYVAHSPESDRITELWSTDAFGRVDEANMTRDIFYEVLTVGVHAR